MKEYRAANGETRIWYEPSEIDRIMLRELISSKLMPRADDDDLTVDIEGFVEKHLRLRMDQHAELDSHILGVTEFRSGENPKISINRDLTGSALDQDDSTLGLIGRWRATIAHEASHVLLHRHLLEFGGMHPGSFGVESASTQERRQTCLKRDVGYGHEPSDWREVQANIGMGALLMPKPLFVRAIRQTLDSLGLNAESLQEESAQRSLLVDVLASRFSVSKQAARIRISGMSAKFSYDALTFK